MAVNVLLSYAFHAKTNLHDVRRRLPCGRLLIDSGAFTAESTGKPIRLEEYAEYLQHWRGAWNHAVTLDVIGDPVGTRRQTAKLHDMGLPVMPVFTTGESLTEFDAMVRDVGYVCVGGGVGMAPDTVMKRVAVLQHRAEQLGGGIHALGLGALPALRHSRPYSADASNISGTFRFGTVAFFDGTRIRTVKVNDKPAMRQWRDQLRAHGINVASLASSGRMPGKEERGPLMRAMSVSYVAADEYLKRNAQVPVPHNVTDTPGTHLYSSIIGEFLLDPALEVGALVHGPTPPRVYAKYAAAHQCTTKEALNV